MTSSFSNTLDQCYCYIDNLKCTFSRIKIHNKQKAVCVDCKITVIAYSLREMLNKSYQPSRVFLPEETKSITYS